MWICAWLVLSLAQPPAAHAVDGELPIVTVTADNTRIERPCIVRIPTGTVIADSDDNGVIQIAFDGGELRFEKGSVLRGSALDAAPDTYRGTGIRIENRSGVTITGARIEGFKVGLHATETNGLTLDKCIFRDNFRQRLKSTPRAEDGADWLWPHSNDGGEWRTNYGAGACIERSERITIRKCVARAGQNGLIIDRVSHAKIYDNDFSFLSGWGLAMWRSCDNLISRNALDFCIRGYSHGVYNRGQDSAGILCFEQCSRNKFVENSVTHGGDGFFGFAGKEALGEAPAPAPDFDYKERGCNENLFDGNDFSYAAAHGLELTFSFGNTIRRNRFVENAICGIWGGYSNRTRIEESNEFTRNGDGGYGLERGGVNIEHGSNNSIAGRYENNACGVHLWWDQDEAIARTPWALANGTASTGNLVGGTFKRDRVAIHLQHSPETVLFNCEFENCGEDVRHDDASKPGIENTILSSGTRGAMPTILKVLAGAIGDAHPVGARPALAARQHIIMTQWGPWDHESPLIRLATDDGYQHGYDLYKIPAGDLEISIETGQPEVEARIEFVEPGDPRTMRVFATSDTPGVHPYTLRIHSADFDQRVRGTLINCSWNIAFFPTSADPREKPEALREAAAGDKAVNIELNQLKLPFGHGGPSDLKLHDLPEELKSAKLPRDRFGMIASTVIPLSPGRWRIVTLSDDGVRVTIRAAAFDGDGIAQPLPSTTVIENWTHHGPTRDEGTFEIRPIAGSPAAPIPVRIEVEHFELDGFAVLELEIEPLPAK